MKISIITATYNSADTLRDTLESVLSQDYDNYEHIIVDGGSTDNTLDILEEYLPKYNGKLLYHSEPDEGIYDGMNKGISRASGDVIGILNSDDLYYDSNVLSTISQAIKDVDAIYGNLVFVDKSNINRIIRKWKGSEYVIKSFFKGWHPAHPTFYVKKSVYDKFGIYDTNLKVSADFELMLRFFERGNITSNYVPKTLVKMRSGGESTGSISKIITGNKNVLIAFEKNGFKVPRFYLIKRLLPKAVEILKTKLHFK